MNSVEPLNEVHPSDEYLLIKLIEEQKYTLLSLPRRVSTFADCYKKISFIFVAQLAFKAFPIVYVSFSREICFFVTQVSMSSIFLKIGSLFILTVTLHFTKSNFSLSITVSQRHLFDIICRRGLPIFIQFFILCHLKALEYDGSWWDSTLLYQWLFVHRPFFLLVFTFSNGSIKYLKHA